ncbi:MAG: PLDc N-terminal domain-containing protein, partial [Proteobacteria bacterium]|nr:PLDc N-terminal domain-containing protein [Pseudomonadota bacterium]
TTRKVLWTLAVIVFPMLGFVVWLFVGPRTAKA